MNATPLNAGGSPRRERERERDRAQVETRQTPSTTTFFALKAPVPKESPYTPSVFSRGGKGLSTDRTPATDDVRYRPRSLR